MNRWAGLLLVMVAVAAAGCGDDDGITGPSGAPLVFTAQLSSANEVPAVSNSESGATGAVQVTMDVTRDSSNAITAATADFHFQMIVPGEPIFVGAHIHPGVAGVNGPVAVNTTLSASTAPNRVGGSAAEWTFRNIALTPAQAQAITDNPSAFYFNVHTFLNPGGVARGQLRRTL